MSVSRHEIRQVYQSCGYSFADNTPDYVFLAKRMLGEVEESIAVWMPVGEQAQMEPDAVLSEVRAFQPDGSNRIAVIVLPKLLSYGAGFQTQAKDAGAELRSEAFVLDGGYGGDYIGLREPTSTAADEVAARLVNYGRVDSDLLTGVVRKQLVSRVSSTPQTRVLQKYLHRTGIRVSDRVGEEGTDLLRHLIARFSQPAHEPEVYFIVGAGGAGKSWLFEGLFTYLFEAFQKLKSQQIVGARPVAVLPDDLLRAGSRQVNDLFAAVAKTHYGARGGLGLLDHLVTTGTNVLMFDGLDEFFADDQDFGAALEARYLAQNSRARIVIVLRDSLLETSGNVQSLIQRMQDRLGDDCSIYELSMWHSHETRRELAWLKFEKRRPNPGELDTEDVAAFLQWLESAPEMLELSKLAFFGDLLADIYIQLAGEIRDEAAIPSGVEERSGRQMPEDVYDLLELCLEMIVDRELAKHDAEGSMVTEHVFADAEDVPSLPGLEFQIAFQAFGGDLLAAQGRRNLIGLLEEAAYVARRTTDGRSLTVDRLRSIYQGSSTQADPELQAFGDRVLRQFVLFTQGKEQGTVDFTHDFLADYLAARHAINLVESQGVDVQEAIAKPVLGETNIFSGYIERELRQ